MDASNPVAIIKALLPKTPLILKTALYHSLSLSETSSKWDLRTEITVNVLRSFLDGPNPSPLSKQQYLSLKDPGIKGPMWISKVTLQRPAGDDVREALVKGIEGLKEGDETYTLPELKSVEAEWTGYRTGVDANAPELNISENEKYQNLMKEVKSDVTILYFHGGAHYLMDPASHRPMTSKLAKSTSGRVLSVRYRLAPQNPFPAALLDAFVSYLSLLSPPPGSPHGAIPASQIIFSGDSAGGNISLALLQLILELHRQSPPNTPVRVPWHNNTTIDVPIPAGVALSSPWMDITRCMPSLTTNAQYDYLPAPSPSRAADELPPCPIWPASPPRGDIYADTSALCHPLVSPLAARDWTGACPIWLDCGTEMLYDEDAFFAQFAASQGVPVTWECYEAMPHCFAMLLDALPASKMCYENRARFCRECVERPDELRRKGSKGAFIEAGTLKLKSVDVSSLSGFTFEQVRERMKATRDKKLRGEEGEAKALPKL